MSLDCFHFSVTFDFLAKLINTATANKRNKQNNRPLFRRNIKIDYTSNRAKRCK